MACLNQKSKLKTTMWIALASFLFLLGGGFLLTRSINDLTATVNNDGFRRGSQAQKRRYFMANQLGHALSAYTAHHNGLLPPMETMSEANKALYPYAVDKSIFISPFTKKSYVSNPTLSATNVNGLLHPELKIAFYEVAPIAPNQVSQTIVIFANGNVSTISKYNWSQFKRLSHLP